MGRWTCLLGLVAVIACSGKSDPVQKVEHSTQGTKSTPTENLAAKPESLRSEIAPPTPEVDPFASMTWIERRIAPIFAVPTKDRSSSRLFAVIKGLKEAPAQLPESSEHWLFAKDKARTGPQGRRCRFGELTLLRATRPFEEADKESWAKFFLTVELLSCGGAKDLASTDLTFPTFAMAEDTYLRGYEKVELTETELDEAHELISKELVKQELGGGNCELKDVSRLQMGWLFGACDVGGLMPVWSTKGVVYFLDETEEPEQAIVTKKRRPVLHLLSNPVQESVSLFATPDRNLQIPFAGHVLSSCSPEAPAFEIVSGLIVK